MNRFTPDELYEIFLTVGDDGDLSCPVFSSHTEELQSVAKCLELAQEDQKALAQSLRLAKKALAQEIAEIESLQIALLKNEVEMIQLEDKKYDISSKLCRMMRNYI